MMWDGPLVSHFWNEVASEWPQLLSVSVPKPIPIYLLNICISKCQKKILLAQATAAKKMVATHWKPPYSLTIRNLTLSFMDILYLELSTARVDAAAARTINTKCEAVVSCEL